MENHTYSNKVENVVPLVSDNNVVFIELAHHKANKDCYMCTLKNPNVTDVRVTRSVPVNEINGSLTRESTKFVKTTDAIKAGISCFMKYYKPSGYDIEIEYKPE
jgi:hypothetical protein